MNNMENFGNMHSYARKALDTHLDSMNDLINQEQSTETSPPITKRPSKKSKKVTEEQVEQPVPNSLLLSVMERIEKMQAESLKRLHLVEAAVKDNTNTLKCVTDSLEFLGKQVEDVTQRVDTLKTQVETLEKENAALRLKCSDMDAYRRRWNLRGAGIPETPGENIKSTIIDLLSQVSPDIAGQLGFSVDIAHRLGPRSGEGVPSRRIIVQFLARSHRDKVWKDAKTSAVLKERRIRIMEDLSQEEKDARNKLWPVVEQARKEGKRAGFRGSAAYIDGKRVSESNR